MEIKAANVVTAGKDSRRLYEFAMRVTIKRNQAPAAAAPAASAASAPKVAAAAKTS